MSNVATAAQAAQTAASSFPDTATFAANIVVFIAAIAAVVAGAWTAITQIKKAILEGVKPGTPASGGVETKIASAMLMETTTLMMWSESNRDVCESMTALREEIRELRHELELDRATRGNRR